MLGGVLAELERAANYELWAIVMVVSRAPKDLLTSSWSHSYSGSTLDSWFTFKKKWIYIQGFSVLCSWIHLSVNKWVASWVNSVPFRWRKGGFPPSGRVNLRGSRCAKKLSFLQEGGVSKGKKQGFLHFCAQSLDFSSDFALLFAILCKKCFRSTFLHIVYHQRHIEMAGQKVS